MKIEEILDRQEQDYKNKNRYYLIIKTRYFKYDKQTKSIF